MTTLVNIRRLLLCCAALAFTAYLLPSAYAQNAELTGTILDPQGQVIPHATITVINQNTGVRRTTVSTGTGDYDVPSLAPDSYTIRVRKNGFETTERAGITLNVATVTRLDFHLVIGREEQTVTVNGSASGLQTENATFGQVIENKDIVTFPLNGRSYTQLAALAPGVAFGGRNTSLSVVNNPTIGTGASFTLSGGHDDTNQFLLNGINVSGDFKGGSTVFPPIDSIQEFKLLQSDFAPQYGFHPGQVVMSTKAGTRSFHGSLYEFLRNDALDATNFFATTSKNSLRQNQFGASLGGPLLLPGYVGRNKTFFFVNYEGARIRSGATQTTTVPTVLMRQGDFSQLSKSIVDPQTGTPFPNNIVPSDRVSPIALNTINLAKYPLPTNSNTVNNYTESPVTNTNLNEVIARIDHNISTADHLFGTAYWLNMPTYVPPFTGDDATVGALPVQVYSLDETHVFSPTLVNELTGGWSYAKQHYTNDSIKGLTNEDLGFPQNGNSPMPIGETAGIPAFGLTGYGSIGDSNLNSPQYYRDEHYQVTDLVSWARGSHVVKAGADFIRSHDGEMTGIYGRGDYSFSGQYSKDGFADFLLGLPSSALMWVFEDGTQAVQFDTRSIHYGIFAEDEWRATKNLSVSLGFRYERNTPPVEIKDRQTNYIVGTINGAPGIVTITAPDPTYGRCLCSPGKNDFGPRTGITYQLGADHKTVVRSGYGIVYNYASLDEALGLPENLPWVESITVTNTVPTPSFDLANSFLPALRASSNTPYGYDLHRLDGRIQQWTLGLQRELRYNFILDLSYLGSSSSQLDVPFGLNTAQPGPGSYASRRLYPNSVAVHSQKDWGRANYQAGTVELNKVYSNGLMVRSNYTWSKGLDDGSSQLDSAMQYNNPSGAPTWGLSGFNIAQRVVASAVYELPFGKGKAFLSGLKEPINIFASGWSVAPIYTFQTGFPFSVAASSNTANIEWGSLFPDQIGKATLNQPTRFEWFNTAAFAQPAPYQYGTGSRNNLIGPGYQDLDLAVIKETQLSEQFRLQFRGEFFNTFNEVNFSAPNSSFGATNFGSISSTAAANREIQFGLKVLF